MKLKKMIACILSLCMLATMMPATVLAEESTGLPEVENGVITLTENVELTETLVVAAGEELTLDLAGHTISGTCNASQGHMIMVENTAILNIKDSSEDADGKITYAAGSSNVGWVIDVEGTLNLYSGTIELTGSWSIGYAVDVRPNSWGTEYTEGTVFNMKGGKIISSDGAVRVASSSSDGGQYAEHKKVSATFVMDGGSIEAEWDGIFVQQSNAAYDILSVEINDGTISSGLAPIRFYGPVASSVVNNAEKPMNVEITGGTFDFTGDEVTGTWLVPGVFKLGGDVATNTNALDEKTEIEISGGSFDASIATKYLADGVAVIVDGDTYSYYPSVAAAKEAAQEIADETGNNVSVYDTSDLNDDGTVADNAQGETVEPTPDPVDPTPSKTKKSTKKYAVSIDDDEIENGSIKLSSSKAKKGATVTLTVTPDAGYKLDKLVVLDDDGDKVELTDKGNGKFTFKMPRGGVEVDASFVEIEGVEVDDEIVIVLTIDETLMLIDGEYVVNDVAPIIRGERTVLPIRVIAEALGASVSWNEAEQTVTIVKGEMTIVIYIGQAFALVNGEPVALDQPAFIENGRTYLPLRFIMENLGAEVTWDALTQKVTIVG